MKKIVCIGIFIALSSCQSADRSSPLQIKESTHGQYVQEKSIGNRDPALLSNEVTHKVNIETPYYKYGPQQGQAADGVLSPGTKLKIIEPAWGSYALVVTESGITGYVSLEALKPVQE